MTAAERILALLEAASRLVEPASERGRALRQALVATTGLSVEGVEWGLRSLETSIQPGELRSLLASVTPAERVWVVLAANTFVAPLRAILLALAASPRVLVRPSSREAVLATALHEEAPGLFELVDVVEPKGCDVVHAYGRDATLRRIQAGLPPTAGFWGHGAGLGACWITSRGALSSAAGIVLDSVLFEQRGCLSPRVVVVEPDVDLSAWLTALSLEFRRVALVVPPGTFSDEELAEQIWFREVATVVADEIHLLEPGILAVQREPAAWLLAPPGRSLVVVVQEDGLRHLKTRQKELTAIGVAGDEADLERATLEFPTARVSVAGRMQLPRLDGPVDRRATIE